jgi:hypothetical protein
MKRRVFDSAECSPGQPCNGEHTMRGTLRLIALLTAGPSAAAFAQAPAAPAAMPAPGSAKLLGSWSGTYATEGPSGSMSLMIAKESDAWKITTALDAAAPSPGEVRDLKVEGTKVSWNQLFGDYDVAFEGALSADGSGIEGTLQAMQGGAPVGGGSFTLKKK